MEIRMISFQKVIEDITSKYSKIPKSDFLKEGMFSIIDQGKDYIAGFTDNIDLISNYGIPVIVFGDHTRVFKYIDFPFAIGADGVKVLYCNNKIGDVKCIYYYLKKFNIPSAGYSRHYKFLKQIKIPIPYIEGKPDLLTQKRIAKVLSNVEKLITKRKESITMLDELVRSTFLEMFGDPVRNEKEWKIDFLKHLTSKIGSGSTPKGGEKSYKKSGISLIRSLNVYDNIFKYDRLAFIDDKQAKKLDNVIIIKGDVLFNITGASVCRSTIVPDKVLPARVNQHVAVIRCINEILSSQYLTHLIISYNYKKLLLNMATRGGATREAITKDQIENFKIPIPPIDLQNQFANIVNKVEKLKEKFNLSLQELKNLYGSLSQKAFKGELDLSKVVIDETQEKIKQNETIMQEETKPIKELDVLAYIEKQFNNDTFSFEELKQLLDTENYEYSYENIKETIFQSIDNNQIEQIFDEQSGAIKLKKM